MRIQDWLRDGFLGKRARLKHTTSLARKSAALEELLDPSGRHDFGRRAHHPDPAAHYGFEPSDHRQARSGFLPDYPRRVSGAAGQD